MKGQRRRAAKADGKKDQKKPEPKLTLAVSVNANPNPNAKPTRYDPVEDVFLHDLEMPDIPGMTKEACGEFWIRHIDAVLGMRTSPVVPAMKTCVADTNRVLALAKNLLEQQQVLVGEMKYTNFHLDMALNNEDPWGVGDYDILNDPEADRAIVDALTQLRRGDKPTGAQTATRTATQT